MGRSNEVCGGETAMGSSAPARGGGGRGELPETATQAASGASTRAAKAQRHAKRVTRSPPVRWRSEAGVPRGRPPSHVACQDTGVSNDEGAECERAAERRGGGRRARDRHIYRLGRRAGFRERRGGGGFAGGGGGAGGARKGGADGRGKNTPH